MKSNSTGPFYIYRYFDAHGNLLYLGKTDDPKRRDGEHRVLDQWSKGAIFKVGEIFKTAREVQEKEIENIKKEKPLYNKAHNREAERRVPFSIKLRQSFIQIVRVQAAMEHTGLGSIVEEAIAEYVSKHHILEHIKGGVDGIVSGMEG